MKILVEYIKGLKVEEDIFHNLKEESIPYGNIKKYYYEEEDVYDNGILQYPKFSSIIEKLGYDLDKVSIFKEEDATVIEEYGNHSGEHIKHYYRVYLQMENGYDRDNVSNTHLQLTNVIKKRDGKEIRDYDFELNRLIYKGRVVEDIITNPIENEKLNEFILSYIEDLETTEYLYNIVATRDNIEYIIVFKKIKRIL